jgi:type II secretory pathway component GspD/PulD (secretin)
MLLFGTGQSRTRTSRSALLLPEVRLSSDWTRAMTRLRIFRRAFGLVLVAALVAGALSGAQAQATPPACTLADRGQMEIISLPNPSIAVPGLGAIQTGTGFGNYGASVDFTATALSLLVTDIRGMITATSPCFQIFNPPRSPQVVVLGTVADRALVHQIIDKMTLENHLVVLEMHVYEVDETSAKNLGINFTQPLLTEQISENGTPGASPPPLQLGRYIRSPLSILTALNLLVQNGNAYVLADPNVTTTTGEHVQIHAGEDLNVLAYPPVAAGAATGANGVIVPTLQTFALGVNLEVIPIVSGEGDSIALTVRVSESHLLALVNGGPEISRRDETTTVYLKNDQMVVLGGLRLGNDDNSISKIPVLGDIPLIGGIFRNKQTSHTASVLLFMVTPHVIDLDHEGPCDRTRAITSQPRNCAAEIRESIEHPK